MLERLLSVSVFSTEGALGSEAEGLMMPIFSSSATRAAKDKGLELTVVKSAPSSLHNTERSLMASLVAVEDEGAVFPLKINLLILSRFLSLSQTPAPSRTHNIGYGRTKYINEYYDSMVRGEI